MDDDFDAIVGRLRAICLGFPGTSEKLSHGEPAFFVAGRQFANLDNHHHGSPWLAVWCAAADGAQQTLVESRPERFFRPPTSARGTFAAWIGVCLDTATNDDAEEWAEIAAVIEEAFRLVAPKSSIAELDRR